MTIHLADHYGMCFGVRDALATTKKLATAKPITILGQLVHNPEVDRQLAEAGVAIEATAPTTEDVVITAHGTSDQARTEWKERGFSVHDTTCPLVRKAHKALAVLVATGHHPVVIGRPGHIEVRGLTGDFPHATIIEKSEDIENLPQNVPLGIVSQTTQPLAKVARLVEQIELRDPDIPVTFRDTVCQPTKDRQSSLEKLCRACDTVVVVGGNNSNNTHQLAKTARQLGAQAYHVETAADLRAEWFHASQAVGVTAGTSTLEETVQQVVAALRELAA